MSANVERMFYVGREVPWHGLGTSVEAAPTSADALEIAGLDWNVRQSKLVTVDGLEIPDRLANIRSDNNAVLGTVSTRYKIVQNKEAFEFTDSLIGGDVRYETAGSLGKGETIWLLARLPETNILGDETTPFLCFTNTHDGTGAVRVCCTPVRVVCNNTLNLALDTAPRAWATSHMGNIQSKMMEAKLALEHAGEYMANLEIQAERYANLSVTREEIDRILSELFPIAPDASNREIENRTRVKDEFMVCYFAPDIAKFQGTAWGLINAMSDMATHNAPARLTKNYQRNNWGRVIKGHPMIDGIVKAVNNIEANRIAVPVR